MAHQKEQRMNNRHLGNFYDHNISTPADPKYPSKKTHHYTPEHRGIMMRKEVSG